MTEYTIKYAGFDNQQRDAISAILDLSESALACNWRITDGNDSDMVMINLNADDGQQLLAVEQPLRPAYRIILVAEHSDTEMDDYWFLSKKPLAPPSLKEFAKLLNEIAVVLAEAAAAEIITPESDSENTVPTGPTELPPDIGEEAPAQSAPAKNTAPLTRPLYPRNYFFGLLLQARKDQACRVIKLNKQPNLYLSPAENSYYFSGSASELLSYCTTTPQYLEETVITKQRLVKILKSGRETKAQALDVLIAYAVIEASQGRLLEGHSAEQAIKLAQLPDTGKIPMLASYKKIAEYFYQQPGNLFQAAETLQIPLSLVFEFYNACYALGYLVTDTPTKTEAAPIEPKKSGKLSHFLKMFLNK